jgi:hypothetical protein
MPFDLAQTSLSRISGSGQLHLCDYPDFGVETARPLRRVALLSSFLVRAEVR